MYWCYRMSYPFSVISLKIRVASSRLDNHRLCLCARRVLAGLWKVFLGHEVLELEELEDGVLCRCHDRCFRAAWVVVTVSLGARPARILAAGCLKDLSGILFTPSLVTSPGNVLYQDPS